MKKFLFILSLFITQFVFAQSAEITKDASGNKIIKGFMTKNDIAGDSAFAWYAQNQKGYEPDPGALQAFKSAKDSIHILAFAGTWCSDTKTLLPKFFALTDAAGFSQDRITLLGVDRNKKTIHHLAEAFKIINVPTFIVLKNGEEIGRVVEYGKYGMIDKELGEIINSSSKNK
ncbi:MAG TPA: thioredoxin family protein [Chitinophagaceae bacterium]|nr:thioredoxin family protein [Chitinophagaceae bacterium]